MTRNLLTSLLLTALLLAGSFAWLSPTPAAAAPLAQNAEPSAIDGLRIDEKLAQVLIPLTSDVTGLTVQQVKDELITGKSLAQIAEEQGQSGDDIVQLLEERTRERLDRAVERGRMSQERADEIVTRLTERATEAVNVTGVGEAISAREERRVRRLLSHATADITGLSFRDVGVRLRDGETLAQIAESEGFSSTDVVEQAVDIRAEQLGHAVAGGRMTQEDADERLATLRATAEQLVDDPAVSEAVQQQADRAVLLALGRITVDQTGIPAREVLQRVRDGETLAQIAESGDSSGEVVVEEAVNERAERLNRQVRRGWLTQTEADERIADFEDQANRLINEAR